jgi:hypothetical protein
MTSFFVKGVMLNKMMEMEEVRALIQYHFFKLIVRSTTGPHTKRQRLAVTPSATISAVRATVNPFYVSR